MKLDNKHNQGYMLIVIVLIVSASALGIGIYLQSSHLVNVGNIPLENQALGNFIAAQGCLEEAMYQLRLDQAGYASGGEVLVTIDQTTCTIDAAPAPPPDPPGTYTIDVIAVYNAITTHLLSKVHIVGNPPVLTQLSWQEIP